MTPIPDAETEPRSRLGETFRVRETPCPDCGALTVIGYLLVGDDGRHQHTRYVCARYLVDERRACNWSGWTVE